jgi:cell fate regulator YaaT (PSP1 superfamily)
MIHSEFCVCCLLLLYNQYFLSRGVSAKLVDEAKALELCRTKVKQRKLPMEVIDAEYQW